MTVHSYTCERWIQVFAQIQEAEEDDWSVSSSVPDLTEVVVKSTKIFNGAFSSVYQGKLRDDDVSEKLRRDCVAK